MTAAATTKLATSSIAHARLLTRILQEGYGSGAWHGPDFKAALGDVTPTLAFWRPAKGRHNIAEIATHHAYSLRSVRGQITKGTLEPFALTGEDWFALSKDAPLKWPDIIDLVATQQSRLEAAVAAFVRGNERRDDVDVFQLALGVTCHAVYHAGQVQLIKRLHKGS